jgi:hypothetical protein
MSYLGDRFAGVPVTSNCAEIPVGNSLAPLKIRKKHRHHHHQ